MTSYTPAWLDVADVKAWLRLADADTGDDDLVTMCAAAVEPQVQRARPDGYPVPVPLARVTDGGPADDRVASAGYTPDAEVYQAAVALAGRLVRRRNSPGGVETFGESITYVSRYDPEIARALRTGLWAMPGVG